MRLYEWANRGRLVYLVHIREDNLRRPPRRTLYPFTPDFKSTADWVTKK